MTLPTGLGKTLLAATWVLELRDKVRTADRTPRIVIVLPYLSIIDQTQEEYRRLLSDYEGGGLLSYHSLSERSFDSESGLDDDSSDFFVDTWRSDVVITTFDQFLFALMSPKARHQMRFHQLCDALIVMDEIQTLPCRLWNPLAKGLEQLTDARNTHVLAMSATQPRSGAKTERSSTSPRRFFERLGRYRLGFAISHPAGSTNSSERSPASPNGRSTRSPGVQYPKSAPRRIRDALAEAGAETLHFLSADVTPGERLREIERIKQGRPALVVATQCVEAGVQHRSRSRDPRLRPVGQHHSSGGPLQSERPKYQGRCGNRQPFRRQEWKVLRRDDL